MKLPVDEANAGDHRGGSSPWAPAPWRCSELQPRSCSRAPKFGSARASRLPRVFDQCPDPGPRWHRALPPTTRRWPSVGARARGTDAKNIRPHEDGDSASREHGRRGGAFGGVAGSDAVAKPFSPRARRDSISGAVSRRPWRRMRWRTTSEEAGGRAPEASSGDREFRTHVCDVVGEIVEEPVGEPEVATARS